MRIKNKHRALRGGGYWVVKKEGRRERSERSSREIFIPRESGGGPVRAPCLMRGSRFPHAGLPSGRLPIFILKYLYINIF